MSLNRNIENTLWVEKYRPKTMDDYVGNQSIIDTIKTYIENDDIPNLLLYGSAGTGKTTLGKIVTNTLDCDCLYINASDENNIDTVRDKIKSFVSSIGFKKWKLVFLDECLEAGTLVRILRNGGEISIPIEDLDPINDLVKSFNVDTKCIEWVPFTLYYKDIQNIWEIELENGFIIRCTDDHKWYVLDDVGETIVVKTIDLHKYDHILSPK